MWQQLPFRLSFSSFARSPQNSCFDLILLCKKLKTSWTLITAWFLTVSSRFLHVFSCRIQAEVAAGVLEERDGYSFYEGADVRKLFGPYAYRGGRKWLISSPFSFLSCFETRATRQESVTSLQVLASRYRIYKLVETTPNHHKNVHNYSAKMTLMHFTILILLSYFYCEIGLLFSDLRNSWGLFFFVYKIQTACSFKGIFIWGIWMGTEWNRWE